MTHQTLSLGKYWKLNSATLVRRLLQQLAFSFITNYNKHEYSQAPDIPKYHT